MGYYSRLEGRIEIHPPLTWAEVRDLGFTPDEELLPGDDYKCVHIEVDVVTKETDEGTLTTKRGVAIVPASDDQLKFYSLAEQMRLIGSHPVFESRELTGYIVRIGESSGDVERFDGKGRSQQARMVWPDGTTVNL